MNDKYYVVFDTFNDEIWWPYRCTRLFQSPRSARYEWNINEYTDGDDFHKQARYVIKRVGLVLYADKSAKRDPDPFTLRDN